MRTIIIISIIFFLGHTSRGQDRRNIEIPAEMSKLDFLIGKWDYDVKTFNKVGEVIRERSYFMTYEKEFNGMLIVANSGFAKDGKITMGQTKWLFFEKNEKQFKQVNYDVVGNFNTYIGEFVGKDLIIQYPNPVMAVDSVARIWRKTYRKITPNSFQVIYDYSENDGKTWKSQWEQNYKRKS